MAERNSLLTSRRPISLPRVRIPPSPYLRKSWQNTIARQMKVIASFARSRKVIYKLQEFFGKIVISWPFSPSFPTQKDSPW